MRLAPLQTLRGRLLLVALLVEALMLVILVSNSLRLLRNEMGEQAREQAAQIAPVLSAALVAPLAQSDYATVQAVLDESHAIRGIDYLAVSDSLGAIVATSGWPSQTPLPPVDADFSLDDDPPRYDVALPIRQSGQTLGTLQFGLDLKRIVVARNSLLTQGVIIAGSELLLSAGLLTLLGFLITRQLSLLTAASLKVAEGQLTLDRVPEGRDDVGRLGAAFNVMSRAIVERIEQLTRANEETAQLAAALKEKHAQLESSNELLRCENSMRVEAQHELESALRRVREHAEQLNAIFDLSPDGFVSFDAERRIKYASPAFLGMSGMAANELIGCDETTFSERLAQKCIASARFPGFARLHAGIDDESQGPGIPADRRKPRRRRQLIELAGPGKHVLEVELRLSAGESVSQILYFRDVTNETEVDRMKSEFLSHAAHELRTPMASIYGYSELMLAHDFSEDERHEFLAIIYRQSELMIAIINELLDLVRIEERRGKDFDFARIDAGQLVREVVADFGVPAGRQAASLHIPDGPHWVCADAKKLMQAVRNILSNAYKYSPAGGEIEVVLGSDRRTPPAGAPARIGIRVTDHGIGMTPEQAERVCERFYRADTSGRIPGTGLGMSIVKEIIDLHGGEVELDSRFGQGTTVSLWVPAAA